VPARPRRFPPPIRRPCGICVYPVCAHVRVCGSQSAEELLARAVRREHGNGAEPTFVVNAESLMGKVRALQLPAGENNQKGPEVRDMDGRLVWLLVWFALHWGGRGVGCGGWCVSPPFLREFLPKLGER
jgi:hypothetical protein